MSATAHSATAVLVRRPFRALRFSRDEELVRLVRAGDERAFEAIYDRHHRGILAFARHMLGSAEEAEDVVQHTFISAHRDIVGSDKPIQLKAWLYTIARNRCLSLLRARREERALEDVPEPSVEGLGAAVQRRQDLRDLLADLQRLPEDQRAALVLAELGALTHEEIGATLGVRKDKVKALVFQARESLASSRQAREVDCREIQEQLAVLRGGSLRRTTLRRHVEVCPACAAFKAEVKRQRSAMAAILPVVPSLALKQSVLAGIFGGGGGAAGGGLIGGGLAAAGASGGKALVAKVATLAVVAGGATGGGIVAVDEISGGGGPETATAMAGVPGEQRSVKMVDTLRERARDTARERAADRGAPENRPASAPAVDGSDESQVVASAPRRRARERDDGDVGTAGVREEGGTTEAAPPAAPVATGTPPADEQPKAKPDKAERKEAGSTAKGDTARGPGVDPRPDRGSDGERGHRRPGRRKDGPAIALPEVKVPKVPLPKVERKQDQSSRQERKPAAVPPPAPPVPAPPPQPQQDAVQVRERARSLTDKLRDRLDAGRAKVAGALLPFR